MSVISLIQSLTARAARLETDAQELRAEARKLSALFLGTSEDGAGADPEQATPPASSSAAPKMPVMPNTPPAQKQPTTDEIRAKAKEFGVDITDVMPLGKKPTLQQKQDATKKIVMAKRKREEEAAALTAAPVAATPPVSLVDVDDDDSAEAILQAATAG